MDTGKFFKPVLLRSKLISSDSYPSQSGAYTNAFFAKASSFSFLKFLIAAGKLVNLLPERSRKVRLVNFSKLTGRSLNKLLSDSSFFNFPNLPKFSGNESSWLWRILRPYSNAKSQIESGKTVSLLFLKLSFFIFVNLSTVSTDTILFLLNCNRSKLG